ncbi:MAG: hypothetical protein P8163_15145 [Candidatus Thiodiazotropha sp.]
MKSNVISLFLLFLLIIFIAQASAEETNTPTDNSEEESSPLMPTYGNWCGLNHPKDPLTAPPPVDTLDSICKQHDFCYLANGHMDCNCDSDFIQAINANRQKFAKTESLAAHTFRVYFRGSPCYGDQKDKIALTRALTGLAKKADARTQQVINKFKAASE